MRLFFGLFVALVLLLGGGMIYAATYGNLGILYNGCFVPHPGLRLVNSAGRFTWFPPRFVCEYRTKDGRVVERGD